MANFVDASAIAYTTKTNPEYFIGALKKAKTLDGDYVRVLPNVVKDTLVKKLVLAGNSVSQQDNRDCAWNPTSGASIDSKEMSVKNYKVNIEECLETLDNLYSEMSYTLGANPSAFPTNLEDGLMYLIQNALGNDIENLMWGSQEGFVVKALASAKLIR